VSRLSPLAIRCNYPSCQAVSSPASSAAELLEQTKAAGWRWSLTCHYCPPHAATIEAIRKIRIRHLAERSPDRFASILDVFEGRHEAGFA
jgi:hypothetical protein